MTRLEINPVNPHQETEEITLKQSGKPSNEGPYHVRTLFPHVTIVRCLDLNLPPKDHSSNQK